MTAAATLPAPLRDCLVRPQPAYRSKDGAPLALFDRVGFLDDRTGLYSHAHILDFATDRAGVRGARLRVFGAPGDYRTLPLSRLERLCGQCDDCRRCAAMPGCAE